MIIVPKNGYQPPQGWVICLDEEADVCAGTNQAGYRYDDEEDLGDI